MPSRLLQVSLCTVALSKGVVAAEPGMPVERQVALMVAAAASDRNMASRAGGEVKVLVVSKSEDGPARRLVSSFLAALKGRRWIAGLPHQDSSATFTSPAALAELCRAQRIAILYFTPSLDAEVPAIARALDGVSVLSVAASAEVVSNGAVMGFDVVSGRPRMVVNLEQARRQKVHLDEAIVHLVKVVP
jgi:hypothetical protein